MDKQKQFKIEVFQRRQLKPEEEKKELKQEEEKKESPVDEE
jgi:hypothetical protein